jgi:hypothetical protein
VRPTYIKLRCDGKSNNKMNLFALTLAGIVTLASGGARAETAPERRPPYPTHVRAVRQDFRAARVTWDFMGRNLKYRLYASYDKKPYDFHMENNAVPFSDTFAIWDTPRDGPRKFVFYVTSVDPAGNESPPSKLARVNVGPPPAVPTSP